MNLPVRNEQPSVCRRLRTKQAFMHASSDEPAWQSGESLTATIGAYARWGRRGRTMRMCIRLLPGGAGVF